MNAATQNQDAKDSITTNLKAEIAAKRILVKELEAQRKILNAKAKAARVASAAQRTADQAAKVEARGIAKVLREKAAADRELARQVKLGKSLAKIEARAARLKAANAVKASVQRGLAKSKAAVRKPSAVVSK